MSHVLRVGQPDQIAYFRAYNTDGSANTSLTASTTGLTLSVFRVGASSVSIASLSNKAADNTAHADGAIRNVGGNLYTIDLPDAACATQVPSICVRGSYTGGVIEGLEHPITAYDPAVNYASSTQATAIETDTVDIQARIPAALVGGRIDASVGNYQAGMAPPTTAQIEAALVNEGDATALLQAIADKISNDLTAGDLTALAIVQAIKNDATLAQMISRIDAQITSRPTLAAIEGSLILAKESTVTARPTLAQIEASPVLAKEATLALIAGNVTTLVNRITSGVASMFGDLITMITGAGTVNARWTLSALQFANGSNLTGNIERSVSDTNPISFSWPVTGATITAEKSMNNGDYSAVEGAISFIRTESGRHYYAIAYDPNDRNTEESSIRYKLTDGTYTKYFNLRLVPPGVTPEQIEEQLADNFQEVIDAVSSPTNSDKVLVDENYGGANRLTYMLRGRPVSDATIEVYLHSDYILGRFNDAYRLDRTRQRIDGTWEKAFYLDPGQYAIRFNKSGVAGPDDYYVIVSFEESEIRIQKI